MTIAVQYLLCESQFIEKVLHNRQVAISEPSRLTNPWRLDDCQHKGLFKDKHTQTHKNSEKQDCPLSPLKTSIFQQPSIIDQTEKVKSTVSVFKTGSDFKTAFGTLTQLRMT